MKKVLMIASVASMIKKFNMNNIKILQQQGFEVHVASNFGSLSAMSTQENNRFKDELASLKVHIHQIDFPRGIGNLKVILVSLRQLSAVVKLNKFYFIHCQSPIGGACGRIVGHKYGIKVIYTAHGFHFYKGGSLASWLLIYPVEKYLSKYTDILLTINKEDFYLAKKKFHAKMVSYLPGVGIDVEQIKNIDVNREQKRSDLGIPANAKIVLSVGELNDNKNHAVVIKALGSLKDKNVYYIICGIGNNKEKLNRLAKENGLEHKFKLLGYRTDVTEIMKVADLFVFPSIREGLPVSLMEAMAAGLPIVASNIRGNTDLVEENKNGYLFSPNDVEKLSNIFANAFSNDSIKRFVGNGMNKIKKFDVEIINKRMNDIYRNIV